MIFNIQKLVRLNVGQPAVKVTTKIEVLEIPAIVSFNTVYLN